MTGIKRIYKFLGSIYFAIILISLAALMVIIGTFIESFTDSHLLAAKWTYHHPSFILLLGFFFINILFSALQRWPFQWRHLPFLITHLGLLMIIGGTILKNKKGLQGNLTILEGAGTQEVHLPHTHSLYIEKKEAQTHLPIKIDNFSKAAHPSAFPELSVKILAFYPHVKQKTNTWIKKNHAYISGQNPLVVHSWQQGALPKANKISLENEDWDVLAIRTDSLPELIEEAFLHELNLVLSHKFQTDLKIITPLKEVLTSSLVVDRGVANFKLSLSYTSTEGFDHPEVQVDWQSIGSQAHEKITIPLVGAQALLNLTDKSSCYGEARFAIDFKRKKPLLVIAQDEYEEVHLLFFDKHGRLHANLYSGDASDQLFSYDNGYGGYAVQAQLPFPPFNTSRIEKIGAIHKIFAQNIEKVVNSTQSLVPPLEMFKKACELAQLDFGKTFAAYLSAWQQSRQLLFRDIEAKSSLQKVFTQINWSKEKMSDKQACQWIVLLFNQLNLPLSTDQNIVEFLKSNRWPFVFDNKHSLAPSKFLTDIAQQIFSISNQLPYTLEDKDISTNEVELLSAYFKAYGIDYHFLSDYPIHYQNSEFEIFEEFKEWTPTLIETPLKMSFLELSPGKIEDQQSCIILEFSRGRQKECRALAYDPLGLKWPILKGEYLIRYQSEVVEIPYRIRLRQAREIYYPHTQQPYSYEGDILIQEKNGRELATTLSMNRVHETWEGYRFYLSGIGKTPTQNLKYAQIIVNHDPGKYWLTYPGGICVFIGIVLLFWFKKHSA